MKSWILYLSVIASIGSIQGQSTNNKDEVIDLYHIDLELLEACVLAETNKARQFNKVNSLKNDELLQKAALLHSNQMSKYSFFNHTNPKIKEIATVDKRLQYYNYPYTSFAENILYTYIDKNNTPTYQQLAATAVNLLYKSKEHKKNMINSIYEDVGIGITLSYKYDANYVYFYLTQDFGTK